MKVFANIRDLDIQVEIFDLQNVNAVLFPLARLAIFLCLFIDSDLLVLLDHFTEELPWVLVLFQ